MKGDQRARISSVSRTHRDSVSLGGKILFVAAGMSFQSLVVLESVPIVIDVF